MGCGRAAVLLVARFHPFLPGFAFGKFVAQSQSFGQIGAPVVAQAAFELGLLDGFTEYEAVCRAARDGGHKIHAFLVHEIGQNDVAIRQGS